MRLHDYPASANCYKVRLLLAQLELDYERVTVDIFAADTLTDEFGVLNPARETPVLEEDEAAPLPESNAILFHLAEGTEFLSGDPNQRGQTLRWLFWEQSQVIPGIAGLRFRLQTGRLNPEGRTAVYLHAAGEGALAVLDGHLAERDFMVDRRYSVADISLYAYVHVAGEAGLDLDSRPAVRAWLARVEETTSFMNDLEPYPANTRPGASRSIYD